ncbi:GNAT family N-acetyltransferase [Actinomadura sp. WMMB 499]|nr:GNAT family N-acetyltransferase [Actinomadura sp. WMMB 499]
MSDKPSVLFVCVHNAGRSQMAAAFVARLSGGAVEVRSAGSAPADEVNPAVVAAMAEVGIDVSAETPKVLTADAVRASDVCVTMGCGDACPVFPGKRYLDWTLPDPAGQGVAAVRPIRDEIERRVRTLLDELGVAGGVRIARMDAEHADQVLAIYQAGIDEGEATFETAAPTWDEFDAAKLAGHRLVALDGGTVLGWAAVGAVSGRCVYGGVVEHSLYVHPDARGRGVGLALLRALLVSTEAAGIWTVQAGIFPENAASLALHRKAGFRTIGVRERIGRHHGRWRDVVLLERRSPLI